MIKLDVNEHCHDCPYFQPEATTKHAEITADCVIYVGATETVVQCRDRKRCDFLLGYFRAADKEKHKEEQK